MKPAIGKPISLLGGFTFHVVTPVDRSILALAKNATESIVAVNGENTPDFLTSRGPVKKNRS